MNFAEMDNKKKAALIGGVAVLLVLLAWTLFGRGSSAAVDHPDGFKMVCQNGHEFTMSESAALDFKKKHPGEPIPCPKCGDTHVKQVGATGHTDRPESSTPKR